MDFAGAALVFAAQPNLAGYRDQQPTTDFCLFPVDDIRAHERQTLMLEECLCYLSSVQR